jgi:hypothetical protein
VYDVSTVASYIICTKYFDFYLQDSYSEGAMNIYHEKFLTWRFQKVNRESVPLMPNYSPPASSVMQPPLPAQAGEWHVR